MVKFRLILIFISFWCFTFGQVAPGDDFLEVNKREFRFNKKQSQNATWLVEKLTKGKESDKEKFDAIFFWVSLNITYNINEFYLPGGSISPSITRILDKRATICLGYANLMDTLCKLAGITNVTVFGYAKDAYFDVGDSIYGHNHAWNAVKLDNLWYLYDVTWSSGITEYRLARGSAFREKWLENHPETFRKKVFNKTFRKRFKDVCGEESSAVGFYYKQRTFNRIFRRWLSRFHLTARLVFLKGINSDYYLSTPEIFAVTHLPDSPIWNLGSVSSYRQLENDSAYYYLTDSVLKHQVRSGTECEDCDRYVNLSEKERLKDIKNRSSEYNKRNKFITAYCETELGHMNFNQFKQSGDSLEMVKFLDSASIHYTNAVYDFRVCRKNVAIDLKLQKNKNKRKMNLLFKENKQHAAFINSKVRATIREKRNFQELKNKSEAFATMYEKRAIRLSHFKTKLKVDRLRPYSSEKLEKIHVNLLKNKVQLDSVKKQIDIKRLAFDSIIESLSLNIWPQVFQHDSVIKPFYQGAHLRIRRQDNYKKVIVDIRKKIPPFEFRYNEAVNFILYKPAIACTGLFNEIYTLVKLRTNLQRDGLQYNRELMKAKEISNTDLEAYKMETVNDCKLDYCWIVGNYPKVITTRFGFYALKQKQDEALVAIAFENMVERYRYSAVNESIKRGYRGENEMIVDHIRSTKKHIKKVARNKKEITRPKRKARL